KAYGQSKHDALKTADNIQYFAKKRGNVLTIHPYFKVRPGNKWRKQELELEIGVPEGMHIFLEPGVENLIRDVSIESETGDYGDISGHYWRSGKNGLECTDCWTSEEL